VNRQRRLAVFALTALMLSSQGPTAFAQSRTGAGAGKKPKPAPTAKAPVPEVAPPPAPAPAPATPPPPVSGIPPLSETLNEAARKEYEAAKALYQMGDSKGAFYKFQAAYELYQDPRLLWNMATCSKNLRQYAEALDLVRRYQKLGGGLLDDNDRREAGEVERALTSLTTTLTFKGIEPGTTVTVDTKPVEKPAEPLLLDLGPHTIVVARKGFRTATFNHNGKPSGVAELDATLAKELHEGTLVVTARAGDSISVDGKMVALGNYRGTLRSGGHIVRVSAKDYQSFQQEIQLVDDETRTLPVALDREKPFPVLPIVGAVVAVGAAVTAIVLLATQKGDNTSGVPKGSIDPGIVLTKF
jgi:hypothetical protein